MKGWGLRTASPSVLGEARSGASISDAISDPAQAPAQIEALDRKLVITLEVDLVTHGVLDLPSRDSEHVILLSWA